MTSPQLRLLPTCHDDGWAALCAFEFVTSGRLQFVEAVRTEVCQRMSLEPGPEIFDRIEVRRVRWQECDLNVPIGAVEVFAHQFRLVCPESIEDDQQRLLQMRFERLEKLDNLLLLNAALVEAE